jgi:hypothetical protein
MVDHLNTSSLIDAEIEAYKRDVDRTLLRENLKMTVNERFHKHRKVAEFAEKLRAAGRKAQDHR